MAHSVEANARDAVSSSIAVGLGSLVSSTDHVAQVTRGRALKAWRRCSWAFGCLRGAPQADDRQLPVPAQALDLDVEPCARLAGDQRCRLRARGSAGPVWSGLNPRPAMGRKPPEVDFVRRATQQARVGSVRVVPADDRVERAPHRLATEWNRDSPGRFLQTSNGPLNDRNAAVLPDGPEPELDPVCPAPLFVTSSRPELWSLVADQVLV